MSEFGILSRLLEPLVFSGTPLGPGVAKEEIGVGISSTAELAMEGQTVGVL